MQLGLRGVTSFINGTDVVDIQDVSEFVHTQGMLAMGKVKKAKGKGAKGADDALSELMVAREVRVSECVRRGHCSSHLMLESVHPREQASDSSHGARRV